MPTNFVAAVLFVAVSAASQTNPAAPAYDAATLADFNSRIQVYVSLREKAEAAGPQISQTSDSVKLKAAKDALAGRISAARAGSKRGDIFSPAIERLFLASLQTPLNGAKGAENRGSVRDEAPVKLTLAVNGRYPDDQPVSSMPPNVLAALPSLPGTLDLEYRFVQNYLILRDTRANVIIDFIATSMR
jgi:hypothetical protein